MLENSIQTYRSSYKCLTINFSVCNKNIAQSSRVSPNGIEYHIFHRATGTCSINYPVGKQCFVYLHFTNNFVIPVMFISFDLTG